MTTREQMRRLEALEAQARQDDIDPYLAYMQERHGFSREEVLAEAECIASATAGMTDDERQDWAARQIDLTPEAFTRALEEDREAFALWRLERSTA